jgi:hypothetical protein
MIQLFLDLDYVRWLPYEVTGVRSVGAGDWRELSVPGCLATEQNWLGLAAVVTSVDAMHKRKARLAPSSSSSGRRFDRCALGR